VHCALSQQRGPKCARRCGTHRDVFHGCVPRSRLRHVIRLGSNMLSLACSKRRLTATACVLLVPAYACRLSGQAASPRARPAGCYDRLPMRRSVGQRRIQERLNARAGPGSAPKVEVLERGFNGFYQVRCVTTGGSLMPGSIRSRLRSRRTPSAVCTNVHDQTQGAAPVCSITSPLQDCAVVLPRSTFHILHRVVPRTV